jgi:predicted phosphodiesterase
VTATLDTRADAGLRIERAGLIGDVHSERTRLEGVLAHFARLSLDRILCTGDLGDGPHDARDVDACCSMLQRAAVVTVSGNHDRWLQDGEMRDLPGATDRDELRPETLAYLAALPATREFESPAGRVLLCHGIGGDDMAGVQPYDHGLALENNEPLQQLLRERRHRFVISGHTHRPMVRELGELTIINAGTLLGDHNPCCSVLDLRERCVQFYDVAPDGTLRKAAEWAL